MSSRRDLGGARRAAAWLALAGVAALLVAACGAGRTAVRSAPVASLSDAIECSLETGREMDFEAVSIDRRDHRVVLERTDRSVRRSDPQFHRAIGQLVVEEAEGESGAAGELSVEARTFHEHFDRTGRTRRQREPSDRILAAADSVLTRCASGGSSVEAPAGSPLGAD